MEPVTFSSLGLAESILGALDHCGFKIPTPIQAGAIPALLEGRDMMGLAQTGTGKTGAFALPILHHLQATPKRIKAYGTRVLILAPTRELAVQIETELKRFSTQMKLKIVTVLGGVGRQPQVDKLSRGADIVVGTPGRLCDLISTNHLRLDEVDHFVLDEADRMLDLGFIRDIRRIAAAIPANGQTLLFSATMAPEVGALAEGLLKNPVRVSVTPTENVPTRIDQYVHHVGPGIAAKRDLLARLMDDPKLARVIIFSRTKHGANKIQGQLQDGGHLAEAIHGNKSQSARQKSLERFRTGKARILVATDIAARGIDISGISHVLNYDLPNESESYVHRIGRTARNGTTGVAISFCDPSERGYLRAIERLTRVPLIVASGNLSDYPETQPEVRRGRQGPGQGRPRQDQGRQGHKGGAKQGTGQARRPQSSQQPRRAGQRSAIA